jgi:dimethylsulfone monooxygenase
MSERREKLGLSRMQFGVAGYAFTRASDREVQAEIARITDVKQNAQGYANYQQWLQGTELEQTMSIREYSVSNRGLRSGLVGTPAQVQQQIGKFREAGVDLLLLQFSPQLEEMERFSDSVISRQ